MNEQMKIIGEVLHELIYSGHLSREKDAKLYDILMENDNIYGDLEIVCSNLGLYLHQSSPCFYVSPIPGYKAFSYTNEELRKAMLHYFRNEDMFTVLFIISVIVTEFFPEAGHEQSRTFLRLNDIVSLVDERIDALKSGADLEQVSYENSYNFEIVVKKWSELITALPDKNDSDEVRNKEGRDSKLQMITVAINFLKEQDLIHVPNDTEKDKYIYVTERFKATVYNIYRRENVQSNIYNIIDGLKREEFVDA